MKALILDKSRPDELALLLSSVRQAFPALNVSGAASSREAASFAADCEVLIAGGAAVKQSLIDAMPRLRWIQTLSSGVDALERLQFAQRPLLTSVRGVHGPQMSELAVLLMLASLRDFPRMLANQGARRWERWPQPLLCGRTVVVLGVGSVGECLAVRCAPFGMTVLGVSSSRTAAPGFEKIFPREELSQAAALADFFVVLAPYSAQTHQLVDGQLLDMLKPGCVLINLARGRIVDQAALRTRLESGRLRAAGLDVFEEEPLPADDPLWTTRGVIVTPHIGGLSDVYAQQCLPILLHNLRCYCEGRLADMRNVIWGASPSSAG